MKKIIFKIPHGVKEAVYSDKQWEDIEKLSNKSYQYIRDYMEARKKEHKNFSVEKEFKKEWSNILKKSKSSILAEKTITYKVNPDISEEEFKGVVKLSQEQFLEDFNKDIRNLETLRVVVDKLANMESTLFLTEEQIKRLERVFISEIAWHTNLYDLRGIENIIRKYGEYIDYLQMLLYRLQGDQLEIILNLAGKDIDYYRKMSEEDLKHIIQNNL